jgi:thermitase
MLTDLSAEVFTGAFGEWRTTDQSGKDREAAGRQLKELNDAPGSEKRVRQIIENIMRRQDASERPDALRIDCYPADQPPGSDSSVLIARGELVARITRPARAGRSVSPARSARRRDKVMKALDALDYATVTTGSDENDVRDPRTMVFRARNEKTPDQLKTDIATLRKQGIDATMNPIVPLGHIIKGDDYPSATTGPTIGPMRIKVDGSVKVRVAVIDTGIAPDLRRDGWLDSITRTSDNKDHLDDVPDLGDGRLDYTSGHGTFTMGVVQQVAPGCEIVAYRFTRGDGLGTAKDVAEAMIRAAEDAYTAAPDDGTQIRLIINASVGAPAVDGQPPIALRDAVQHISEKFPDVLIVASAGNTGTEQRMYPAGFAKRWPGDWWGFDNVVAVGALKHDLEPAGFSNHGSWVTCSSIGVGVVSTFVPGRVPSEPRDDVPDEIFEPEPGPWALWSGTSFSAPQISAAVARWCYENPGVTPKEALKQIFRNRPKKRGYGRILKLLPGTPSIEPSPVPSIR